jgi:hypothetical protein
MTISELQGDEPIQPTSSQVSPIEMSGQSYTPIYKRVTGTYHEEMLALPPRSENYCESTDSRSAPSHHQRSSGSIVVPSSISSSPPDGPSSRSVGSSFGCLCMARPSKTGSVESCVLDIPVAFVSKITPQDTIEVDAQCTSLNNRLRLFESFLEGNAATSGIWNKTRRLVISDKPDRTGVQTCRSFWVPLADLQYTCYGTEVLLRWSDCNQKKETRLGDSNLTFSRIYVPTAPNNELRMTFQDSVAVQKFIYFATHVDLNAAILWRRIGTPSTQELRVFKAAQAPIHYVLHVSRPKGHEITSKMFIQQTNPVFDIWTHPLASVAGCGLSVRFCGRVSTPHYHSDVVDKPSDDKRAIGRCARSSLVFDAYTLTWPPSPDTGSFKLSTGKSVEEQKQFTSLTATRPS